MGAGRVQIVNKLPFADRASRKRTGLVRLRVLVFSKNVRLFYVNGRRIRTDIQTKCKLLHISIIHYCITLFGIASSQTVVEKNSLFNVFRLNHSSARH